LQHEVDRLPGRFERGIVERALRKGRGKSRRDQEHIAFTQGNLQSFGELQHHFTRRRGTARLHKAEVARGYLGVPGQIELAQMAALPPFAEVIADMEGLCSFGSRRGSMCVHGMKPTMRISPVPLRPR